MNLRVRLCFLILSIFTVIDLNAQDSYRYSVDLNNVSNDQLNVELISPVVTKQTIIFIFPGSFPVRI